MTIALRPAAIGEAERWLAMQVEVYTPYLEKYRDYDIDPAAETIERVRERFQPWREHFWIVVDGEIVGAVRTARFVDEPGRHRLGNIMILPSVTQHLKLGKICERFFRKTRRDERAYPLGM
jgi:hypothetical protein